MAEDDKKSLLSITSSAESPLTAVRITAKETISELFRFDVEAIAPGTINATNMLNKQVCVAVNHGGKTTRYFHGIVSEFGVLEQSGVVDKLYKAMAKVMASPKVRDALATLGAEPTVMGPDEFAAYVKADEKQLVPLIRSLGLTTSN